MSSTEQTPAQGYNRPGRGGRLRGDRPMPEYNFLRDILTPYMRASKGWLKDSTLKTRASDAKPLERIFKGVYVTLQPRDMCQHRNILTGKTVTEYRERRKAEGISPATIARELSVASEACRYAICEMSLDIPNLFKDRRISQADARALKPRDRVLDEETELNPLLIALPQPARDMVLLYLEIGLRVSECRTLRFSQIDFDRGTVSFRPDQHKSGDHGASALTVKAIEIIRRQPVVEGSPFVFHVDGEPVRKSWLRHAWDRAREHAGCPDLQLRDLRRTALTRWRRLYGLAATQAQARHKSERTTERVYARPSVEVALQALRSTSKS